MGSLLQWTKGLLGTALAKEKSPVVDSRIFVCFGAVLPWARQFYRLDEMSFCFRRHKERNEVQRNGSMHLPRHSQPIHRLCRGRAGRPRGYHSTSSPVPMLSTRARSTAPG